MRIVCPMCGFSRVIDDAKIPPRAQMATCPKCHHKFRFRVVDDIEPEPPAQPARPTVVAHAGMMTAQRAAAAEAWKRLQGDKAGKPKVDAAKPDAAKPGEDKIDAAKPDAAPSEPQSKGTVSPDARAQENAEPPRAEELRENGAEDGAAGGPEAQPASPVPFEALRRYGFFPGLFATIRMILAAPAAFFRVMPRTGGVGLPLAFNLLLSEFMVLCQYMWGMAGIGAFSQYTGSSELMDMGVSMAGASPLLLFVFYPLLLVLRVMVLTAVVHLLLKLMRSGGGGAEATFRVLCYSAGPLVCGVVPFLGPLVGGLWSIGLTVVGLKETHRTTPTVALFVVLAPILLLLAAVMGFLQGAMKAV